MKRIEKIYVYTKQGHRSNACTYTDLDSHDNLAADIHNTFMNSQPTCIRLTHTDGRRTETADIHTVDANLAPPLSTCCGDAISVGKGLELFATEFAPLNTVGV